MMKMLRKLMVFSMVLSLCFSVSALPVMAKEDIPTGQEGVHLKGAADMPIENKAPVTVTVGDKTYSGSKEGNNISFDMGTKDNTQSIGGKVTISDGKNDYECTIGHKEGNDEAGKGAAEK